MSGNPWGPNDEAELSSGGLALEWRLRRGSSDRGTLPYILPLLHAVLSRDCLWHRRTILEMLKPFGRHYLTVLEGCVI